MNKHLGLIDDGSSQGEVFNGIWIVSNGEIYKEPKRSVGDGAPEQLNGRLPSDYFNKYAVARSSYPKTTTTRFLECSYDPGEYHKRIYRPFLPSGGGGRPIQQPYIRHEDSTPRPSIDLSAYLSSVAQLRIFCRQLESIFNVIEPVSSNLSCYGHAIRNLLIIACTEVESHWKAVLVNNSCPPTGPFYKTTDYQKLCDPLYLKQYAVEFPLFPGLGQFQPFLNWSKSNSTQSIQWYDSYNKTKHDRESNFASATLQAALQAVAASAIMVVAQFGAGEDFIFQTDFFLHFVDTPKWKPEDMYRRNHKQVFKHKDYQF